MERGTRHAGVVVVCVLYLGYGSIGNSILPICDDRRTPAFDMPPCVDSIDPSRVFVYFTPFGDWMNL